MLFGNSVRRFGNSLNHEISGTDRNNTLFGNAGNDILTGFDGDDILSKSRACFKILGTLDMPSLACLWFFPLTQFTAVVS
jgi:RTX calcium-binding nonapeptide repeat (4 copies)